MIENSILAHLPRFDARAFSGCAVAPMALGVVALA
jgi:hypothetical protein